MAPPKSAFPLALPPRPHDAQASRWLYESLRSAILEGRLATGSRLPTTRELSNQYELARGTVVTAFENLKAEGYVNARVGSGTYVACELPESLLVAPASPTRDHRLPQRSAGHRRRLSAMGRRLKPLDGYPNRRAPAFRLGMPALDRFPTALWAQVASRRLRRASARLLLGGDPMGFEPLRRAIAEYLVTSRAVNCTSAQVAIVSGTLEALSITARLLLDPGDRVVVEDPWYHGAKVVLETHGAKLVRVPVDDGGLIVLPKRMRGARLACVTPAHQYPTGVSMCITRRLALLEWARRTHATIFEDDYDSEYRYCGPPMPALQGLDGSGRVIFSGSYSKVLFPSLRLGYVVLPEDLVEPFAAAISVTTRHAPLLDQAVLADFITEGHYGRHIRRMREIYAARHRALIDAAREHLDGLLDVCTIEAGLQTIGWLAPGVDGRQVSERADSRGVEVKMCASRRRDGARQHALLLGFAAVDEAEIRRGVGVLRDVIRELR